MNKLKEEIEFRLKNDLWNKQMSKKIRKKIFIKTFMPFIKIAILFFSLSIGIAFWYIQEMNKKQFFVNLLLEYQSHDFLYDIPMNE